MSDKELDQFIKEYQDRNRLRLKARGTRRTELSEATGKTVKSASRYFKAVSRAR
jgi:hypothetical protein